MAIERVAANIVPPFRYTDTVTAMVDNKGVTTKPTGIAVKLLTCDEDSRYSPVVQHVCTGEMLLVKGILRKQTAGWQRAQNSRQQKELYTPGLLLVCEHALPTMAAGGIH